MPGEEDGDWASQRYALHCALEGESAPAVVSGGLRRICDEVLVLMEGDAEADDDVHAEQHMQHQEYVGRQHVWRAACRHRTASESRDRF